MQQHVKQTVATFSGDTFIFFQCNQKFNIHLFFLNKIRKQDAKNPKAFSSRATESVIKTHLLYFETCENMSGYSGCFLIMEIRRQTQTRKTVVYQTLE